MRSKSLLLPLLFLLSLDLHAGFFGDLFNKTNPQKDIQITQEDAIIEDRPTEQNNRPLFEDAPVEEEVISAEDYIDSVDEPTDFSVFSDEPDSKAFDENEEYVNDEDENPYVNSKSIFLSYEDAPSKIYLSQHATVKVKAVITQENIQAIKTTFSNSKNVEILNPNSPWKQTATNTFINSFIFKPLSTSATLPNIKISAINSRDKTYKETLKSATPSIIALREDKEFCFVLSEDLTLQSHHEKKYDEKNNIVVLEINATNANLEDFHIPYASRDGIDSIKHSGNSQNIYYFAIIPNTIKVFKFKYFDLNSNKYNIVSFPVVLLDSSVSTQTDLNPQKSRLERYKAIFLITLAVVLALFYFKTKKMFLLVLAILVAIFALYRHAPISKIQLREGMKLRILPTKNSTVFYKTESDIKADILLKKDGYIKILLPNKKIGWIYEDLTKN